MILDRRVELFGDPEAMGAVPPFSEALDPTAAR